MAQRQTKSEDKRRQEKSGEEKSNGGGRYPCRIPIRMTAAERAVIGKSACAADLSVSRYLVETATQGRTTCPQDRARIGYLRALFQEAADKTHSLLASPLLTSGHSEVADVQAHLTEAARLLACLSLELGRRLENAGSV